MPQSPGLAWPPSPPQPSLASWGGEWVAHPKQCLLWLWTRSGARGLRGSGPHHALRAWTAAPLAPTLTAHLPPGRCPSGPRPEAPLADTRAGAQRSLRVPVCATSFPGWCGKPLARDVVSEQAHRATEEAARLAGNTRKPEPRGAARDPRTAPSLSGGGGAGNRNRDRGVGVRVHVCKLCVCSDACASHK